MIINSIYALIATFCFAVLSNARGKKLIFASVGGGITWFIYLFVSSYLNLSSILSYFSASLVGAIYSETMARVFKTPVTTFIIGAIIPLVPGSGMYNTMFETVQGNIDKSLATGINTIGIAGTIAVGVFSVSSISKAIILFKRKLHLDRLRALRHRSKSHNSKI
ncbi:threonine/serine exporter family protein [Clostridium tyrobutyricum]|uniref:threonine/serine exporter family protein n=1 Tax=Clostridium tyrobutyricum TaxID=1519 RepID=UPI001C381B95|nr:threonine/serine exporter family protein [Clostridium tyrobutyricum]MBV4418659.1 threonine/serine exporter family protein [Clostridium tyrobutyricum]